MLDLYSARSRGTRRRRRLAPLLALVPSALGFLLLIASPWTTRAAESGEILRVPVKSSVHRVMKEFIQEALEEANSRGAHAVVLELDTPGGLVTETREINAAILASEVPVVVYVSPSGAHAASAGFFILMAADVAAMAPGTNTGSAASVTAGGADIPETMQQKVEQDSLAYLRSLADRRGRDSDLAQLAVTESRSFSPQEALDGGLIDLIAPSFEALMVDLDGREFQIDGEETVSLVTAGVPVRTLEMSRTRQFLAFLANPNIAYLLMTFGGLALMVELYNPGSILPGVVGVFSLILAGFGLSILPVNYAGIALIVLGLALFALELKVVSYGLLTLGGTVCLIVGGMLLYRDAGPAFQVSAQTLASVAASSLAVVGMLIFLVVRTHRAPVHSGMEGLMHEQGQVRRALAPKGKVFVHGELWNAVSTAGPVAVGQSVEVVGFDSFTLQVKPLAEPAAGPDEDSTV